MFETATRAAEVRRLRNALGLTPEQFGWLLGVGERTIFRLEGGEPTGLDDAVHRLVWLINATPRESAVAMLEALLVKAPLDGMNVPVAARREALAIAESRLAEFLRNTKLRDQPLSSRRTRWVYWATGARADEATTGMLAEKHHLICRPVEPAPPYLAWLRAGDEVLLCHNANPLGWFRLREERPVEGLPPVFKFIPLEGDLGQELKASNYRLSDGELPGRRKTGVFSCLSVEKLDEKIVQPAPRGRGIRDTMTPFVPAT